MRSHLDNGVCGEISKYYDGGGHSNASGFKIKRESLQGYIVAFPNLRRRLKEILNENYLSWILIYWVNL